MVRLEIFSIDPEASIQEAIARIDRNAKGIVLVINRQSQLIGTITDGDIRRAILAGHDLTMPVSLLLKGRELSRYPRPITAPTDVSKSELLHTMNTHGISQIPLVDDTGNVVDIAFLNEIVKEYEQPLSALVMAGGFGKRLYPLTKEFPKPMLPIGDRPILEFIIQQLKHSGIQRVNLAIHYKGEMIEDHFGDGENFGVSINYIKEEEPLGTVGALGLMNTSDEPILIINGDILNKIDFRSMAKFHRMQKAEITVAIKKYDFQVPYGVLECDGPVIKQIHEKPLYSFFVNAGIYIVQPSVKKFIPKAKPFDMPDLLKALIRHKHTVVSYPIVEYWLDIGRHDDYQQAQRDIREERKE
jgi:dTDP-glucose pyrophosphorylase/CBS domain-containing protein